MVASAVESYLAVRRACGFVVKREGYFLRRFAAFSDARGEGHVRSHIAIEWAGLAGTIHQKARRLNHVIRFSRYMHAEDQSHEVPPPVFGSERRDRPTPYIVSPEDVARLIRSIAQSSRPFRRQTYATLVALLSCTGMRISEAIGLRLEDITPDGIIIRSTKFRKSRLVPLHETAQAGLERYLERRRPYAPYDDHVFVSLWGTPLRYADVQETFKSAVDRLGLPTSHGRPTLHSLRHAFAVRALQACPDDRSRIGRHILALSTYLGHGNVCYTYWYLEATPELMEGIAKRCESFVIGGQP